MAAIVPHRTEPIVIDAGATVLVLGVSDDRRLHQLGFGGLKTAAASDPSIPMALYPVALPTHGEEPLREPALRISHGDGATSTRLTFRSYERAEHDHGLVHRVVMDDRAAPVAVTLAYRTWPGCGVLEQWIEVVNEGAEPITVHQASSSSPAFGTPDPHLTHWGGGWAKEWTETTEALTPGTKVVASAGGIRSSLYRSPVVLVHPDGPATERSGTVALATVEWGGDVRFDAEVAPHGQLRIIAGVQHRGAERVLDPGEALVAPAVAWTWSDVGIGATSRALHRFVRDHVVRDGGRMRATVANTWEAVGFALDAPALEAQVDEAAEIGAELFLLDDGWFGTDHPRDDDTAGLGDWEVDRRKLPGGLQPLIDHTLAQGLRFGLWVEPEMVNPRSVLYGHHPDWVVAEPRRERCEERQQLVLDLCRPDVAAWCVETIDRLLGEHRCITYLKWDANRDLTEPGSTALASDRQSHLALDRVHATWAVMAEVARRHPDVELMLCASGGGRSDLGTLRWFHELWTSDNTDPVERVRIQWGASHLLPASVLGAHVTRWGHRPFPFACAVAMSGRFGFDVDLSALTDEERAVATAATAAYRLVRTLVQHGDLHRLVSPVGSDRAALAYVATGPVKLGDPVAVVFAYRIAAPTDAAIDPAVKAALKTVRLEFLSDADRYEVVDLTPGRAEATEGDGSALAGEPLPEDRCLAWPAGGPPVASVWLVWRAAG